MIIYSDNNIKFEVDDLYYMITSGNKTWYWIKEDGKFDGESWEVKDMVDEMTSFETSMQFVGKDGIYKVK